MFRWMMTWIATTFALLLVTSCGGGNSSGTQETNAALEAGLQNVEQAGAAQNPAVGSAIDGSQQAQPLPSGLTRTIELELVNVGPDLIAIVRGTRSDKQYDSPEFFRYTAHLRGPGTWDTSRLPETCNPLTGDTDSKTILCNLPFQDEEIDSTRLTRILANPGETIELEVVYTRLDTMQPRFLLSDSQSILNTPNPQTAPSGLGYEDLNIELTNPVQGAVYANVAGTKGRLTDAFLQNDAYILNLSGNAQWVEEGLPANCSIPDAASVPERTRLHCSIEAILTDDEYDYSPMREVSFYHSLPILPLSDSDIRVELSFEPSAWDGLQIGREHQQASIDYKFYPDPDFLIRDRYSDLPKTYLIPPAESTEIEFRIEQIAPTTVRARIEIGVSSEFEIQSANEVSSDRHIAYQNYGLANQSNSPNNLSDASTPFCELDSTLICTIPEAVPYIETLINFSLISLDGGDGSMTISIYVDSEAGETLLKQREFTLVQVQSMQIIQDAISNATGDMQIELPAGTYGGQLDLHELGTGKTLFGASGSTPTVLLGGISEPIINFLPARTTLSSVVLRTYGDQVVNRMGGNTTIKNSIIEPADNSEPGIRNSLFGHYNGTGLNLTNNLIQNFAKTVDSSQVDPLQDFSAKTCPVVLTAGARGEYFVRQNIFRNINCENLIAVNPDGNLALENNNFLDNGSLITIRGLPWRLHIRNNILSDTKPEIDYTRRGNAADGNLVQAARLAENAASSNTFTPFTDDYWEHLKTWDYWPYTGESWLEISNNLVWNPDSVNFASNDFAGVELRSLPGVIDADNTLIADPEFVDSDAGNYQLNARSPAIDAGMPPLPYEWFAVEQRDCFRVCYWLPPSDNNVDLPAEAPFQPGPRFQIQTHDGNGDGIIEVDIGAREFGLSGNP